MWTRRQAAEHLGLNVETFDAYVSAGKAPGPTGRRGKLRIWNPADIRACARHRAQKVPYSRPVARDMVGPPEPDVPLWTGRQCADYHGISLHAWKAAVAQGDAPAPVGVTKKNTPVWDATDVRNAVKKNER